MAEADGSVVISVDLNVKEAEKELARLKSSIVKTEVDLERKKNEKLGLEKQLESAHEEFRKLENDLRSFRGLSGEEFEVNPEVQAIGARMEELQNYISKTEKGVERNTSDIEKMSNQIDATKDAYAAVEKEARQLQETTRRTGSAAEEAARAISGFKTLSEEQTSALGEKRASLFRKIAAMLSRPFEGEELSEDVEKVAEETREAGKAAEKASGHFNKLGKRIAGLASRVFVFSLITSGLRSMREWLGKAVKTNAEASAAIAKLRGALLTMVQPLVSVIIPAFTAFVNILTKVVGAIASVVSSIFGTTAEESAKSAEALYDEQNALEGVGGAAKKAGKSLASFDTIQKLSGEDAGAGGGTAAEKDRPDFDGLLSGELSSLAGLFVGLALMAIGAILTFTGANVFLGIGMMVAGAITVYETITNNPGLAEELVKSGLSSVLEAIGLLIAVIGIVFLVMGHIFIGLGLILLGIGLWAIGNGAEGEGDFKDNIVDSLKKAFEVIGPLIAIIGILFIVAGHIFTGLALVLLGISLWAISQEDDDEGATLQEKLLNVLRRVGKTLGPVLAVLGVFLMVTGHLLLGLGFLIVGIGLWMVAEGGDDDGTSLKDKILNTLLDAADILVPVLAVLGVVLMVTGHLIIGLGFLLAGIGLWIYKKVKDDDGATMKDKILNVIDDISGVLIVLGGALMVLGVILLFTGAGTAIGMGMLLTGAGLLFTGAVVPNWDFIKEKLQGAWESVKKWWDSEVSKYFTWDYWKQKGSNMMDGIINGLKGAVGGIKDWGKGLLDKAEEILDINSPSGEFEDIGAYSGEGYNLGLQSTAPTILATMTDLLNQIYTASQATTGSIQELFVTLMLFLTKDFYSQWYAFWAKAYGAAKLNIRATMTEIDALKAKLASIERNIVITITTVYKTEGAPNGDGAVVKGTAGKSRVAVASVPRLAQGAVIPPNREFLAVLGDQRSGTNVETPLSTIRQAVREELNGGGGYASMRNQTVILQLNDRELGRAVYRLNNQETQRVGLRLSEG